MKTTMGQCDFCQAEDVEVKSYRSPKHINRDEVDDTLCGLCAATPAGNAHIYPDQFPDRDSLRTVCYIGNQLLKAIKHQGALKW